MRSKRQSARRKGSAGAGRRLSVRRRHGDRDAGRGRRGAPEEKLAARLGPSLSSEHDRDLERARVPGRRPPPGPRQVRRRAGGSSVDPRRAVWLAAGQASIEVPLVEMIALAT